MNTDEKLDLILNKIIEIDERLRKIETQTGEIHHYVPFVGWLDEQVKKFSQILTNINDNVLTNQKTTNIILKEVDK